MGYTQRLVIGVLITIYAYSLYQDANMRIQFHRLVTKVTEQAQIASCYKCAEQVRNVIATFIFASGVSLIFDISIYMGIISELFLVGLSAFNLSGCFCYGKVQTAFIHLLILLVLISNVKSQSLNQTEVKNSGSVVNAKNVNLKTENKSEPQNKKLSTDRSKLIKQQSETSKKQGSKK